MTGRGMLILRSNTSKLAQRSTLDDIHFIKFWKRIYDQRLDFTNGKSDTNVHATGRCVRSAAHWCMPEQSARPM